jgi:hypothetical protein
LDPDMDPQVFLQYPSEGGNAHGDQDPGHSCLVIGQQHDEPGKGPDQGLMAYLQT